MKAWARPLTSVKFSQLLQLALCLEQENGSLHLHFHFSTYPCHSLPIPFDSHSHFRKTLAPGSRAPSLSLALFAIILGDLRIYTGNRHLVHIRDFLIHSQVCGFQDKLKEVGICLEEAPSEVRGWDQYELKLCQNSTKYLICASEKQYKCSLH